MPVAPPALTQTLASLVESASIVDELRQILDRVDVVMRRRLYHGTPAFELRSLAIHRVDLEPGSWPALARLGALLDLDRELAAVVEVLGGAANGPPPSADRRLVVMPFARGL